jgi:hypothetical protein
MNKWGRWDGAFLDQEEMGEQKKNKEMTEKLGTGDSRL